MDLKIDGIDNLRRLGQEFPKASARALNKTMTHVRAQLAKDARQRYKTTSADVKAGMGSISKAKPTHLSTYFRSKGKRIALTYFMTAANVRKSLAQAGVKIKRRTPVTFQITRGVKRKLRGAFVAKMESGHVGVFTRTGGKPLPIEQRTGPAVPQMLSGAFSRMKGVHEYLRKTLEHEINWFLKGKGGL